MKTYLTLSILVVFTLFQSLNAQENNAMASIDMPIIDHEHTSSVKTKAPEFIVGKKVSYEFLEYSDADFVVDKKYLNRLKRLRNLLMLNQKLVVEIYGYASGDQQQSKDFYNKISMQRAEYVAKYLLKSGVKMERIRCEGHGSRQNASFEKKAKSNKSDQLVEVHVYRRKYETLP